MAKPTEEGENMAISMPVMVQQKNASTERVRTFYTHINPDTGRLDEWGILIGEHSNFEEGGAA